MTNDNRQTGSQPTSAGFLADRRGVSELLGAVLVFALLIILLVLAQVSLVPALNQQVEYEHSQRVSDDVGDFETDLFRVASTGAPASTNFELGVTYPNRPLLLNPAPVQGNLRTIDGGNVVLSGVTSDNPETDDYWTGVDDRSYATRTLEYSAPYNEYRNPGTIRYENGVRYRQFPNLGDRILVDSAKAPLVEGNRITLVTVEGDLQESGQRAESLPISPVSAPSQSVSVRSVDDSTPITITVRTRLSREQWVELIGDEPAIDETAPDGGIQVDQSTNTLTLTLEPGSYRLRMAHVGLGEGFDPTDPAYVTREPGFTSVVPTSGGDVSVQVRDRYNNPVDDAEVTFTITEGAANADLAVPGGTSGVDQVTVRTDENGLATVDLSGNDADVTLEAVGEFDGNPGATADYERVEFGVQIGGGSGDPGDSEDDEINPNRPGVLALNDIFVTCDPTGQGQGCDSDTHRTVAVFENKVTTESGTPAEVRIDAVRVSSYQANQQGASEDQFPDTWSLLDPTTNQPIGDVGDVRGPDMTNTAAVPTVAPGQSNYELKLRFFEDGDVHEMPSGDTALVTIDYSYLNDSNVRISQTSTYFITPYDAGPTTPQLRPVYGVVADAR